VNRIDQETEKEAKAQKGCRAIQEECFMMGSCEQSNKRLGYLGNEKFLD
jgi:hypothetical protein